MRLGPKNSPRCGWKSVKPSWSARPGCTLAGDWFDGSCERTARTSARRGDVARAARDALHAGRAHAGRKLTAVAMATVHQA